MQFTLLTFVTLFTAAFAAVPAQAERNAQVKRQNVQGGANGGPTVQQAAMTNQAGEVVPFDSKNVYLDSVAKGL